MCLSPLLHILCKTAINLLKIPYIRCLWCLRDKLLNFSTHCHSEPHFIDPKTIFMWAHSYMLTARWQKPSLMSPCQAFYSYPDSRMSTGLYLWWEYYCVFAYRFPPIPPASNVGLNYNQSHSRFWLLIIHHVKKSRSCVSCQPRANSRECVTNGCVHEDWQQRMCIYTWIHWYTVCMYLTNYIWRSE